MIGEGISLLGDQFLLIALPWLVLQLTPDSLSLGGILALQGIPRALFMLVGGAVTDRFSPRRVMLVANVARLVIVGLLAFVTITSLVHEWMLYPFALALGLADGFFFPAQNAIVPQIADKSELQVANAVVQGLEQVALSIAPVLAGLLIAGLSHGHKLFGAGVALTIDAATFLVSVVTVTRLSVRRFAPDAAQEDGVLASIRAGLAYMWADPMLRALFMIIVAVNFLVIGPILVGVPIIVTRRLHGNAAAYGIVMSVFGGGSLAGLALAGLLPRPAARLTGPLLLGLCAVFGLAMGIVGFAHSLVALALPLLAMGAASGYMVVFFFTWLQARTPAAMMGRMMSLILFASMGLVPVSQTVAGALLRLDVSALFLSSAILLGIMLLRGALNPSLRHFGAEMAAREVGSEG